MLFSNHDHAYVSLIWSPLETNVKQLHGILVWKMQLISMLTCRCIFLSHNCTLSCLWYQIFGWYGISWVNSFNPKVAINLCLSGFGGHPLPIKLETTVDSVSGKT